MPKRTKLPLYRAQILRMWTDAPAHRLPAWRFSLEEIGSGVRSGFADLDALINHLLDQMEQLPERMPDTQPMSEERSPDMNTPDATDGECGSAIGVPTERA
jgi:hypothetical protein